MSGAGGPDPALDPGRYKAEQRRAWSRAAEGWRRWWPAIEASAQDVSDRLVELAGIEPGDTVLDVATGIGEPAVTAARRVGPAGRVVAIDHAEPMLAVATRRMASLGLTNLELREMDAEALELDERFDAVLCRWGLMFLPELDRALRAIARVLRPGGRFAVAVWASREDVPMIDLPDRIAREVLPASPVQPEVPVPCALADLDELARRLERSGLRVVGHEDRTVAFEFASPAEYVRFVQDVASRAPDSDPETAPLAAELWRRLEAAATERATSEGRVRLANRARLIVAERPVVACPFCGGGDTRLEAPFGSTLGFAQYWCERCRTVFEYLKWEPEAGDTTA